MRKDLLTVFLISAPLYYTSVLSQGMVRFERLSSLPDAEGMAGMFAGVSHGNIFCMGGANFPDKRPWEGGKKVWYKDIFRFDGKGWARLEEKMGTPLAYGVSVEWKGEIILVGGNDETKFYKTVSGFRWDGKKIIWKKYPDLPVPLANMAGARLGSLIIVAGGNTGFTEPALRSCYALDLKDLSAGWFSLPPVPGLARTQPVAGVCDDAFYIFSGEAPGVDASGKTFRDLQRDAYRIIPVRNEAGWTGVWERLADMPRAASASANPVPLLRNGQFLFWGGVHEGIANHAEPATHPGFGTAVFYYHPKKSEWTFTGESSPDASRVTLPAVHWKGYWLYISGEIRPGVRTPAVVIVKSRDGG